MTLLALIKGMFQNFSCQAETSDTHALFSFGSEWGEGRA